MTQTTLSNAEQFRQSFREEAREILTDLEAALLELGEAGTNSEIVGRIFRGLHTIKGSGAMFGFGSLAAFVHDLETTYDRVRDGRLAMSRELVDLTLAALDQIAAMLEEGSIGATTADPVACDRILQAVRVLAGLGGNAGSIDGKISAEPARPIVCAGDMRMWHIDFAPGADLMRDGANPYLLLKELRGLGALSVRALMDTVPPLTEMDPERCYVRWDLELVTAYGLEAIRD